MDNRIQAVEGLDADTCKAINQGRYLGKGVAVFTSGGDAQGIHII